MRSRRDRAPRVLERDSGQGLVSRWPVPWTLEKCRTLSGTRRRVNAVSQFGDWLCWALHMVLGGKPLCW